MVDWASNLENSSFIFDLSQWSEVTSSDSLTSRSFKFKMSSDSYKKCAMVMSWRGRTRYLIESLYMLKRLERFISMSGIPSLCIRFW